MRFFKITFYIFFSLFSLNSSSASREKTSVDLFCKSMSFGFADTFKFLGHKPDHGEQFEKAILDMEKVCVQSPTANPMLQKNMDNKLISGLSCLGFAQGAYIAHTLGLPDPSYSQLEKERVFFANACEKNPQKFQDDIFRKGPIYTLKQRY